MKKLLVIGFIVLATNLQAQEKIVQPAGAILTDFKNCERTGEIRSDQKFI